MADKRKYVPRDRSGRPIKNYRKRSDFIIKGVPNGVKVPGNTPGDLEKALKIFKRQQKDAGTIDELKERQYFVKPSYKNMKKMEKAKALQRRATLRENKFWEKYCWQVVIGDKVY
tara:strand:+ start:1061 stop:1405 length:345 start_codon:yes stop_codon:yes gene_type:complete